MKNQTKNLRLFKNPEILEVDSGLKLFDETCLNQLEGYDQKFDFLEPKRA